MARIRSKHRQPPTLLGESESKKRIDLFGNGIIADTPQGRPASNRGAATLARHKARGYVPKVAQFPSAFPNAPWEAEGIARTLSRGLKQ